MRHDTAPSGFTLVELMIVIVVLAITAVMVLPTLADNRTGRLKAAATLFAADVEYAQLSTAGNAADAAVLVFKADGVGYRIASAADPSTSMTDPIAKADYDRTFGTGTLGHCAGVSISATSVGGDDELGFDARGGLDQTTDATVTFACEGLTLTVTVDPYTGDVSIGTID